MHVTSGVLSAQLVGHVNRGHTLTNAHSHNNERRLSEC